MDGQLAIEHNHEALKRILAMLVAMAGLVGDCAAPTLSRRLRGAVLRLLRPTEAATRRLIIALSRTMRRPRLAPQRPRMQKPRLPFLRDGEGTGIVMPARIPFQTINPFFAMAAKATAPYNGKAARPPVFQLLDTLKNPLRRQRPKRCPPHRAPRIVGFGPDDPPPVPLPPPPSPSDRVDAAPLARRLSALGQALADLPAQARRFKRWQALNARRALDAARRQGRPSRRLWPLRHGPPPGSPPRSAPRGARHEIHDVLVHTHSMALYALERRCDTS